MPTKPVRDRLLDIQEVVELQEFLQREPDIVGIVTTRLQRMIEAAGWSDSHLEATFVTQVADELKQVNRSNSNFEKHHLPTEIMLEIISFTVPIIDSYCGRDYFPRLQIIAQISTFFRDIVLHSPPLWVVANRLHPLSFLKIVLRKSLKCPLAIDMASAWPVEACSEKDFIDTVAPHVDRCRHMSIHISADGNGRQLIEQPAPMVLTADLRSYGADLVPPIRLLGGQADQLRSLRVTGGGIAWDAIKFPRLETLSFGAITTSTNPPSFHNIVQWLKTNPNIITLSLLYMRFNFNTPLQDATPVHLSRLTSLWLYSESPPDLAYYLLPLIRAPALSTFSIDVSLLGETEPVSAVLQRSVDHFIPNMLASFQRGGFVEVEVGKHCVSLCLYEPEQAELVIRPEEPGPVIQWIVKNLDPIIKSNLISLEMVGGDATFCKTGLILLLITSIPNLQHLLVNSDREVSRLFEVLGSPQSNTGAYPFPNLVRLSLRTYAPPELILEMLLNRYVGGGATGAELPQSLEFLSITRLKAWPDNLRQRLEALVGEGQLEEPRYEPSELSEGW